MNRFPLTRSRSLGWLVCTRVHVNMCVCVRTFDTSQPASICRIHSLVAPKRKRDIDENQYFDYLYSYCLSIECDVSREPKKNIWEKNLLPLQKNEEKEQKRTNERMTIDQWLEIHAVICLKFHRKVRIVTLSIWMEHVLDVDHSPKRISNACACMQKC